MAVSYENQIVFTEYLLNRLRIRLAGKNEIECLDKLPADQYHLGVLGPWKNTSEKTSQPELDDEEQTLSPIEKRQVGFDITKVGRLNEGEIEPSTSHIENEDGERVNRDDILMHRGASSALGLEFMARKDAGIHLQLEISFSFYTRRFPTWEQQKIKLQLMDDGTYSSSQKNVALSDRHVRHEIKVDAINIDIPLDGTQIPPISESIDIAINEKLSQEKTKQDVWRKISRMSLPARVFQSEVSYHQYLASQKAEIDLPPISACVDIRTFPMSDDKLRVSIYLVNRTPVDEKSVVSNATRFLIDAKLSCRFRGELLPIEITSAPDDYQYDPSIWAIGQGCSVKVSKLPDAYVLDTCALAEYNQPRLTTRNQSPASFAELAKEPISLLMSIQNQMVDYATDWETKLQQRELNLSTDQEESCRKDLALFKEEISRFKEGIDALSSDPRLLKAFIGMHHAFQRVGQDRGISKWRLFQIGFIVSQLPSLAIREGVITSNTLEFVDVLWFPTGGGKTEAYLGLISCALLYDRLRGKKSGINTWLRFPLRMLSVQQLQRAVKVLYETEKERHEILGSEAKNSAPFSLGYFVGKSSTPNQLTNEAWGGKWKLSELVGKKEVRDQLRLVKRCPACNAEKVEIVVDQAKYRIKHICQACGLDLNIFVSDDEIYRYLPSVLIGTVDKLPSVAWQKNFAHIWGGVDSYCPEHGYSSGKYCIVFGCKEARTPVQLYDPLPSLQIQDELHLLREELGTFAGHYETLAATCEARVGLPPKILAATATVEGVNRQSRHLYGLEARRFPARGFQLGESFYTQYARDKNKNIQIARKYVAFKSPFLMPPEASAHVLDILHSEIRELYAQLKANGAKGFATKLGIPSIPEEDAFELIDKYDTTLTYVGSKAHGSRIERILNDEIGKTISKAGERQIRVSYLNGESTLDDIAGTIQSLETENVWDDVERLDAVIGTSLISHGVDVSRFNLMVMSGMPGRTAEYIQSSSRSGRQYVGIVIVVLSSWSLREQSIYHRFEPYHRHMERLVEPVPINRFSKFAVDKTLPGVLVGILNAYLTPQLKIELTKVKDVQKAMYGSVLFTQQRLDDIVQDAYGLNNSIYSESLRLGFSERLKERFKSEIRKLQAPSSVERVTDVLSCLPMTSLRDIDTPVPFEPKENAYLALRWLDR